MKIVFVCTGNASRSAVAEVILRKMIQETSLEDIEILSCGTDVPYGQEREGIMCQIAAEHGYSMGSKAVMITAELVNAADRIIVMTRQHKTEVDAVIGSITLESYRIIQRHLFRRIFRPPGSSLSVSTGILHLLQSHRKGLQGDSQKTEIIEPFSPSLSCFLGVIVPGLFLGLYIILIFSSSKKFLDKCFALLHPIPKGQPKP